jgi:hypothetical protein
MEYEYMGISLHISISISKSISISYMNLIRFKWLLCTLSCLLWHVIADHSSLLDGLKLRLRISVWMPPWRNTMEKVWSYLEEWTYDHLWPASYWLSFTWEFRWNWQASSTLQLSLVVERGPHLSTFGTREFVACRQPLPTPGLINIPLTFHSTQGPIKPENYPLVRFLSASERQPYSQQKIREIITRFKSSQWSDFQGLERRRWMGDWQRRRLHHACKSLGVLVPVHTFWLMKDLTKQKDGSLR